MLKNNNKPQKINSKISSKNSWKFSRRSRLKASLEAIVISFCLLLPVNTITYFPEIDNTKKAGEYVNSRKTCTVGEMFKYIPKEAYDKGKVYTVDDTNGNGVPDVYWYDEIDNGKIDSICELYLDLNEDGIVDLPYTYIYGVIQEC